MGHENTGEQETMPIAGRRQLLPGATVGWWQSMDACHLNVLFYSF